VRKVSAGLFSLALAATIGLSFASAGSAAPPRDATGSAPRASEVSASDDLPSPLEDKRRELRQEALTKLLNGTGKAEKRGASTVMKLGTKASGAKGQKNAQGKVDQYVELARETTDRIFVVLAEFGDERHPDYPDQDTAPAVPGPTTFEGPLKNAIPAPNRAVDNSTVWQPNYDRAHYQQLYFGTGAANSVKNYYEKQSSGRYSVDGEVTDWVKVRYNEARYGRSNGYPCTGSVCSNTWDLIQDAVNQWVADQKAAGRTTAQITAELKTFDQWDRNDYDGDGDFNEPDGYLDHFQIVHAGGDQADGDPQQGEDAIWSHRWYVGTAGGPANNPRRCPAGRHRPVRRRLHDPAGERRRERLHPRVRPRPGSARRVRHLRRTRRERRQLVDPDGAEPGRRTQRRRHRRTCGRPERLGQAAARLA